MQGESNKQAPLIYDLDIGDLGEQLAASNQPSYRVAQIWDGLYKQLWNSSEQFSMLPKEFRKYLNDHYQFISLKESTFLCSNDGNTIKWLFYTAAGAPVETVLMKYNRRNSLCISTQSGCSLKCIFCATGQMGLIKNLTAGEIAEQVIHAARYLRQKGEHLSNVILMGMGEPLINIEPSLKAINILNNNHGLKMGERRFTISTVGIVPGILELCKEKKQINLAVSLHAANDQLRSSLLPINNKYPLGILIKACQDYVNSTHRRLTFEWALIDGVNDSAKDARELVDLVHGLLCHVNLIPLNSTQLYSGKESSKARIDAFRTIVSKSGLSCTVRLRRGLDIRAGCGQLAATAKH